MNVVTFEILREPGDRTLYFVDSDGDLYRAGTVYDAPYKYVLQKMYGDQEDIMEGNAEDVADYVYQYQLHPLWWMHPSLARKNLSHYLGIQAPR